MGTTDPKQEKNYVIARSVDGLAWTTVATMPEQLASIGGTDGLLVASGYLGEVWTSTDGVTWIQIDGKPLLPMGPLASVLWVGDSLVGTTFTGKVVLSPDGITWTRDEFASSGTMFAMAAGNGQILAVGAGGVIWEVGAARFTRQPESRTVDVGNAVTLSVAATGKEPLDYQWEKNGAPIAGAKTKSYAISSAATYDEGNYSVTVSNSLGSTKSKMVTLAVKVSIDEPPPPPPTTTQARFANIATRALATTGDGVTIGGFVIRGTTSKEVLIRAVGPSLTKQGIGAAEVLNDPIIELHRGTVTLAMNDNWGDNLNAAAITTTAARVGATALDPSDTASAAILMSLEPGIYTVIARGKNSTSGITLLEVYEADSSGSTFLNIASRVRCTTGNGVAIGGFVIAGNTAKQVLLRAVGPTLTTQGIGQAEVLLDPTMELHHGSVMLTKNDDWGDNENSAAVASVGAMIGATPFASGDTKSSALLMTLQPGVYSFIVRGKSETSGIVLVEVYDVN